MVLNLSKTFLTFSASVLLVASSVASSDARTQTKRLSPAQNESVYYHSDYNNGRGSDSSCFRSTGLPAMYACSSNGG
jgi:hypothetical protein